MGVAEIHTAVYHLDASPYAATVSKGACMRAYTITGILPLLFGLALLALSMLHSAEDTGRVPDVVPMTTGQTVLITD